MYEAMARRYRPATFEDVIGQEHVAQTLRNAIASDRVAHAYLFCGPHGCGKTSMARIFSAALVCEKGPTQSPCGQCPICKDVLRGRDVDVQEIDGASNNGVEQVRQLREQAGYVPTRARYKIYIIDEVHMLSPAAFNALLKTLEEPPGHVKFILATTDPHKILETVLSRTQRFDFRLVPPPRLAVFFKDLVAREKCEITDEAVDAVAAFSGGSVRDGLVLLDQLLSFAQGKVTREDVERVRGVAAAEAVAGVYEAIISHSPKNALAIVDDVASRGTNTGDFLDQLIEFGRDLMILVSTGNGDGITSYGPARAVLDRLSEVCSLDQSLLILDVFAQARTRVRSRALSNPLVPLEMAVARLAGLDALEPVNRLIQKLDLLSRGAPLPPTPTLALMQGTAVTKALTASAVAPSVSASMPQPAVNPLLPAVDLISPDVQKEELSQLPADIAETTNESVDSAAGHVSPPWEEASQPVAAEMDVPSDTSEEPEAVDAPVEEQSLQESGFSENYMDDETEPAELEWPGADDGAPVALSTDAAKGAWESIRAELRETSPMDLAFLRDVYVESLVGNVLVLSVPGGGSFIYEQLEDKHRRQRLEVAAEQVLGQSVTIRLALRGPLESENASGQVGSENDGIPHGAEARARYDAQNDEGVKMIVESFNGNVINIEKPD